MRTMEVVQFIYARESARFSKIARVPYSDDEIIATYRFCNMHREHDRVTEWITTNWRTPNLNDLDLWFAMCVARMALNEIGTMTDLQYPVPWNPAKFLSTVESRKAQGLRIYNPAYMIATPNWQGPKQLFLVERLLNPLWANRATVRPNSNDTLQSFFARLHNCYGVGTFTAGQVVADMKYVAPLAQSTDWWSWAAPGPGSRRGLNRVYGYGLNQAWNDAVWLSHLQKLLDQVNYWFPQSMKFHAQDMQNVMCEFDKYERARLGEGRPKQRYVPFAA